MKTTLGRPHIAVTLARLMLILAATVFAGGAAIAGAQTGRNIYAAAELVPVGGEADPHLPGSGATFESREAGGVLVRVTLQGQQANARYVLEIRDGDCAGAVLHTLEAVQTDAAGAGQSETVLSAAVEFGRWHVTANPAQGSGAVLCGSVNPALAGPVAPGMPRTGEQANTLALLLGLLLAATLAIFIGRQLRLAGTIRH